MYLCNYELIVDAISSFLYRLSTLYSLLQLKQMNNPDQNRQPTANNNRKIIFIIGLYLFLIMTSKYTPSNQSTRTAEIKNKMVQNNSIISLIDALATVEDQVIYEGKWNRQNKANPDVQSSLLSQNEGKFKIFVFRQQSLNSYRVDFQFFDGEYIDKGSLYYDIFLQNDKFVFERKNEKQAATFYNSSQNLLVAGFRKDKMLFTEDEGSANITQFKFSYALQGEQVSVKLLVSIEDLTLQMQVLKPQNKSNQIIFFSILMLVCSYVPFKAILNILKSIYQLQDNTRKYSLITIMLTNMWDTVLCIVCFIFSFKDQQSLMLFIIPAFMLCLMFTNLQPRFLIAIYQNSAGNNLNIRQIICRFNLIHYGSLFLIYPFILITNFNWVFFITMSCILFPQIYTNGFINVRPDLSSVYYTHYIMSRFILVFYLKCFPYNIFGFKPDYALGSICLILILIQYALLYTQKIYGSKKVLPSFLLEPVFDYKLQEQLNIQQGIDQRQCSICLTFLHADPPQNANQLQNDPKFRLMKTPCNHSYHSRCLMVWMKIKMECPQCRFKLPPYQ